MSYSKLLPKGTNPPHQAEETFKQMWTTAVAQSQGSSDITAELIFAVWSPYSAFDAAQTLKQQLDWHRKQNSSINSASKY